MDQYTAPTSFAQGLLGRLMPWARQSPQGLLGSGMAQNAAASIQSRPYMQHLAEAKALGQQPLTPEQFMQSMRQAPMMGGGLLGQ
jgi:hypothetical protein